MAKTNSIERLRDFVEYTDAGYALHSPTPKQHVALLLPHREVLYGGAAGGGKSDWLLMAALQYMHVPGYSALLLRRTFSQLTKSDSLIPRSKDWLAGSDASWSEKYNRWSFPSGATLEFGYLQYENDKYNYQSAAYQFVGWDELTQFSLTSYQYLHSRTRRPKDASQLLSRVPIRTRAASNPGGIGHDWVKDRFITAPDSDCAFVPARLKDNPHLDRKEYEKSLAKLDPITRAQLLEGDWTARLAGGFFKREWVDFIEAPPNDARSCRGWDLAATLKKKKKKDPDWTVGARVWEKNQHYFVGPILRDHYSPNGLDKVLLSTAEMDGQGCKVRIEQEPGSSGKIAIAHFVKLLCAFDVRGIVSTGPKLLRFQPFASQCEAGNVTFITGAWNTSCIEELEALQIDDSHAHDDYADGISVAYNQLASKASRWGEATDVMSEAAA